jgi:chromate transporter
LFELAWLMTKTDLFAFGGGFASLPLMFHQVVEVHSWLDARTFLDGIALEQITPGPIVITATFIGYMLHGPVGAVIAIVSVFLPSFLLVLGVAPYFDRLRSRPAFNHALRGVLGSFVGLLLSVAFRLAMNVSWDPKRITIALAALAALLLKVDVIWVVAAGVLASIAFL